MKKYIWRHSSIEGPILQHESPIIYITSAQNLAPIHWCSCLRPQQEKNGSWFKLNLNLHLLQLQNNFVNSNSVAVTKIDTLQVLAGKEITKGYCCDRRRSWIFFCYRKYHVFVWESLLIYISKHSTIGNWSRRDHSAGTKTCWRIETAAT